MVYQDGFLQDYFLKRRLTLQNTVWTIASLIEEHRLQAPDTAEAVAVFRCVEIEPNPGTKGILKLRASIPQENDHEERTVNYLSENEPKVLQVLADAGCSSAPKLLAHDMFTQADDMCDPEGYIVCIMMEALPGETLEFNQYWALGREERDKIREAFRLAITDVGNCGVEHWDPRIRNILWDEEKGKCYIVDFENGEPIDPTEFEWDEFYWQRWELSKRYGGSEW
ncbi:hypothetical protein FQN54_001646 [Arachnomyces sp. PD_36]|nr:hypothetical protein FQN54_001646 [Arachnomyces sp. PD_36]